MHKNRIYNNAKNAKVHTADYNKYARVKVIMFVNLLSMGTEPRNKDWSYIVHV
jgi:hypothetical protein